MSHRASTSTSQCCTGHISFRSLRITVRSSFGGRPAVLRKGWGIASHSRNGRAVSLLVRALIRTEVDGCWVTSPAQGSPKGIVHFLGGAFAGASPELVYPLLLQMVGDAGYTVISTPYPVTFKHIECADMVHKKFQRCVEDLRSTGRQWMVPEGVGIHGLGHSNGALLHLLIGSLFAVPNTSNVLLSFNNKEVREAIPVPLTGLQSAVASARSSPLAAQLAESIPSTDILVQSALAALTAAGVSLDVKALSSIVPAIDQLNSVFNEVGNGAVEFVPSPLESRALIGSSYRVPYTMLVQFENDNIDETQEMAKILKSVNSAGTVDIVLPGSHITPCGGDISWQVGRQFSPLDAIALGLKAVSQADIRRLGDRIVNWLESRRPALQLNA